MSSAKTTETIDMLFGVGSRRGTINYVLDGDRDPPPRERCNFGEAMLPGAAISVNCLHYDS